MSDDSDDTEREESKIKAREQRAEDAGSPGRRDNGGGGAPPPANASRKVRRRSPSHDRELVNQVARLTWFYQGRKTWRSVREVRRDLERLGHEGLGVGSVVACQRAAYGFGFIDPIYKNPDEQADMERLALGLLGLFEKYGLRRVILVPGDPRVLDDLPKPELKAIHRNVTMLMAQAGAAYVAELLKCASRRHPADRLYRIAVARGYTLYEFAKALYRLSPTDHPRRIKVLPTVGIGDVQRQVPVEANINASAVATIFGGVSAQLACPAVVHHSRYELLAADEQVKPILEELTLSDLVVSGFGPIALAEDASDILLTTDPQRNRELFRPVRAAGAIGEASCHWFSPKGEPVDTEYRAIGLDIATLKEIARDKGQTGRTVVMIGGGDRRRIPVLEAAIKGGFVNVVITDTITARVLLSEKSASGGWTRV